MANDLSAVLPTILKFGMRALRANMPTLRLVDTRFDPNPGEKGQSVDVKRVRSMTAYNIVPAATSQTPLDVNTFSTPITLDQWKGASFAFTDKERAEIHADTMPKSIEQAGIALATAAEQYVQTQFAKFFQTAGAVGTVPFAAATIADFVTCARRLDDTLTPRTQRAMVLSTAAHANAVSVPAVNQWYSRQGSNTLNDGMLPQAMGFEIAMSQLVGSHTAGTGTSYITNSASLVAGTKAIPIDTGSGTVVVGDIVTFAGHTQTYVVTSGVAAAGTIQIEPGLVVAVGDGVAMTILGTHSLNAAFHKEAIQFVTRPPLQPLDPSQNAVQSMRDPETGLVLTVEYHREWFRDHLAFSLLYGANVAYREMGCRLLN